LNGLMIAVTNFMSRSPSEFSMLSLYADSRGRLGRFGLFCSFHATPHHVTKPG
jgi:hypothetical protein